MLFLGLLILIVLTFWRPQDFIAPLMGLPMFKILTICLIPGWLIRILGKKGPPFLKTHQDMLMVAFWFAVILSTIYVRWISYTISMTLDWLQFLVFYVLIINLTDSPDKLRRLIWCILISTALTAWMGVMQHYGWDITGIGTYVDGRIRGVGIFDTNQLAYTMAFCTPLAIGMFLSTRSFPVRLLLLGIMYLFSACIFFTQSRGGIACLALVFLLTFLTQSKKKGIKIVGMTLTIILLLLFTKYAPRFSSSMEYKTDSSALGRIDAWGGALTLVKGSPFFGVGKDQFRENFKIAPHSSYIQALTEVGLIGLFIWLSLFYYL